MHRARPPLGHVDGVRPRPRSRQRALGHMDGDRRGPGAPWNGRGSRCTAEKHKGTARACALRTLGTSRRYPGLAFLCVWAVALEVSLLFADETEAVLSQPLGAA